MEELGTRMSAAEFGEWMALYQLEPWGEARADVAAGQVAALIANVHRGRDAPPFKTLDFCPYLQDRTEAPASASPRDFFKSLKTHGNH